MAPVTSRRKASVVVEAAAPEGADGAGRASAPLNLSGKGFEEDAAAVLGELRESFAGLLAAAPAPTTSCAEVEASLGIDAMLAWQVLRIARAPDAFSAGIKVPARVSMEKLLKAASRRRVSEGAVSRAERAFEAFEQLVSVHAGTRAEFEMLVSAYSPEGRERAELAAKQAAFKGMSQIKGVTAEASFTTILWFPGSDPSLIDTADIEGHVGIRRVRPGAPILFTEVTFGTQSNMTTLDGGPIETGREALLPRFCSSPLPEFRRHNSGDMVYHSVVGQDVGLRSSIDLALGVARRGSKTRYRQHADRTHAGVVGLSMFPAKRMTLDVFLHESVYPGVGPELAIYDTTSDGLVRRFNDPSREHDRLAMQESVRPLGTGLFQAGLPPVPRYTEMIEDACVRLGVRSSELRGYRLDVHYPLYGAAYMVAFRLPEPPT